MPHKTRERARAAAFAPAEAPRYRAVADELERQIVDGAIAAGRRIPGEHDLAERFAVSRVTMRAALAVLERKGLVERRAGAGTFVTEPRRVHHDLAVLQNLFGRLERDGVRTERKTLEFRWSAVGPAVARILGVSHATWMRRLWFADGRPFAVTESYLHPDTRAISREKAERTPAYAMLAQLGHHVARADLVLRAETAGRNASELRVEPHAPVLVLQRTSFSRTGEPLEATTCYARADLVEFTLAVLDAASTTPSLRPLATPARRPRPPRRSPTRRSPRS